MKTKNKKLLILIGAPGSGKSTFAKYFIRTEENWIRLCRDDFRMMQGFSYSNLSRYEEANISRMIDASLEVLLSGNANVLLDATHAKASYIQHYIDKFNHLADISFKLFEEDEDVLVQRCEKRYLETGKSIPKRVIKKYVDDIDRLKQSFDFSTRYKMDKRVAVRIQDPSLPKAIICDLDGTLAIISHRNPFDASHADKDELNVSVANVLKVFAEKGYKILLVSGREDRFREPTLRFLEMHQIPFDFLWMRSSGDSRKDSLIKQEIFKEHIEDKYFIEFVLDDRNQVVDLWRRKLNLPCFQVNYGDF